MPANTPRLLQNTWNYFKNSAGETIPPFAVMRVTGLDVENGMPVVTCAKPNSTEYNFYMVNGPAAVRDTKYGQCTYGPDVMARYLNSSTPTLDAEWGPTTNQWYLKVGGKGFRALGVFNATKFNANEGLMQAIQETAGTSAASESDWAQLTVSTGQSISGASPIGTSYTQISFSGAGDSGGILEALSATDEIDCSEAAPTLAINLDATFAHTDVGAAAGFGIVGAVRFAVRRNGSTQNPTFEDMSVLGSATEFPAMKYNGSIITDFSTASAGDDYELWVSSTVDIDINGIVFTIREVKDLA